MRVGSITLRIGERLVAVGVDTDDALTALCDRFADWIDDAHRDIEPAFDLRVDTNASSESDTGALGETGSDDTAGPSVGRGARPVPQLRHGARVIARSRVADDVVDALDAVLGGILARQDTSTTWVWLRPFVSGDRVVLVDATAPMLVGDPVLARASIYEAPTWSVAVHPAPAEANGDGETADHGDAAMVEIPAALTSTSPPRRYRLAGMVAVLPEAPSDDAALLVRYGARHTSPTWFRTVEALVTEHRLVCAPDRSDARTAITQLLT